MKNTLIFFFLLLSLMATQKVWASGVGFEVPWLKGDVYYNGQKIKKGLTLPLGHLLETKKNSFIKISLPKMGATSASELVLGPSSSFKVSQEPLGDKGHSLIKGAARFIHDKMQTDQELKIKTPHMSVGIRGTEYILKVNENLGESEIILFEGKVVLENNSDKSNTQEINPGQWGGVGGRFGKTINPPLTLPRHVLAGFGKLLKPNL
ncbi:MAG: hypothetical protein CME63_06590 [Halobacteriovoraceae bacterium]|nr:hypothetical protein [Halobacteriovoraceae bacterium]|tara:strand:- start:12971 stop:13591 length:621 start_codon:yes stop_codon:yes gene_type:complete